MDGKKHVLETNGLRLIVEARSGGIWSTLRGDSGRVFADGLYCYRCSLECTDGTRTYHSLREPRIAVLPEGLSITAKLGPLLIQHDIVQAHEAAAFEETIAIANTSDEMVAIERFQAGFRSRLTNEAGLLLGELAAERLVAVPFRHRPTDLPERDEEYSMEDLAAGQGRLQRANERQESGYFAHDALRSEGWALASSGDSLGIYKFNQERIEFSVAAADISPDGIHLRFGGAEFDALENRGPVEVDAGSTLRFGPTRLQAIGGSLEQAFYGLRRFLDEKGCRFPVGYDPPVHWNELYDNPEWNLESPGKPITRKGTADTRRTAYTRALLLKEAEKAKTYHCEALYLDPGWDTEFGSFHWAEEWLGPQRDFVQTLSDDFGLSLSLHCPLATWTSRAGHSAPWPEDALRRTSEGAVIAGKLWPDSDAQDTLCLGSRQYIDEAARRLLKLCEGGATFLMFDGNWWSGECCDERHGHAIPYGFDEHIQASIKLAQRVHERYPKVLIEMHDTIAGGAVQRYTPVYYKYGLPGSYDENWGFELMWRPMDDIKSGRARSLYYYNLGCNVPIYLHVDLRDDNRHALVVWWYASTCRHLGIGGSHADPLVCEAQRRAMSRYGEYAEYYKRGEFFGMNEEVHVHALPSKNAFVVNLFNLSDAQRTVGGELDLDECGLDPDRWYAMPKGGRCIKGTSLFSIERSLEPWSAEVYEVRAIV